MCNLDYLCGIRVSNYAQTPMLLDEPSTYTKDGQRDPVVHSMGVVQDPSRWIMHTIT